MNENLQDSKTCSLPSLTAIEHASLSAAVEQAADGIVMTDIDGTIQYVNPSFTAMTGYTSEEAVGRNPRFLKSGRHPAAFYNEMWETIRSKKVWQGELTNRRKDGSVYHEETRISPVLGSNGEISGYVAIKRDITERRAAVETQALLAAIVENSEDSIIACTPAGIISAFNRGAETIFGYTAKEVIGQHMTMLVPPDHSAALEQLAQKLLNGEKISQYEGICLRKDGCTIQVSATGFLIRNSSGKVIAISNILRDVTERKRIERQLSESQELFREVFEHGPVGICLAGHDDRLIKVNESLCRMLGYSEQELLAKNWQDLCPPDDLPAALLRKEQLWNGQVEMAEGERRYFHRDGSLVWCQVRISLLRSSGGKPRYFVVYVADITERRKAVQALRESEERFRSMADSSPSMMWVTGTTGEIEFINKAYREFSGITCEEARAGKWRTLLHPDDASGYLPVFDRAIREHTSFSAEGRVRRADGEWRLVGSRGQPWFSPQGEYLGHIGLRADITDRKQAEKERQFQHSLIRTTFEVSLDGILVVNHEGNVVSHNKRFLDVWHISPESLPDRPVDHVIGAPYDLLLSAVIDRVKNPDPFLVKVRELYANPDANDQCEIELKDGRILERYSTCLRNEDGEYLARAWFFRDITERKQAEQERQFHHSLISAILEESLDGILVVNPEGIVLSHNKKMLDVWSISLQEISGDPARNMEGIYQKPLLTAVLDRVKDPENYLKRINELDANPDVKDRGEVELKDGRTLERYSTSLWSEDGQNLGRARFFRDVTERKQAEQERQFHHSLISALFEVSLDGILVENREGNMVTRNKRFLDVWHISPESLSDRPVNLAVGAPDNLILSAVLDRVKNPDTFLKKVRELYANPDANYQCETELKDGRTLERYTTSLRNEAGEYLARVWFSRDITERKQAEHALRESEDRFRVMADGCPMPMWVTGADGKIQFINRALCEFTGVDDEKVEGDKWQLFSHPDDAQQFIQESVRVVRERAPFKTEARFRRADGEWRWLAVIAEPRISPSGEFLGHIGLGMDITERKQAEQILIESEDRFRIMADSCPIGIWVTDATGKMLFINRTYRNFCGATTEEVEPDEWIFLIHPDDAPEFFQAFDSAIKDHTSYKGEQRARRADGQWRWLESYAVPRFSPDGEFLGLVGTSKDITERKHVEQALQSSEEKFRELTENIREVFWLKTPESEKFLYVSPAYEQVWGRSCASVYQNPASRLEAIHPDDLAQSRLIFARQMQGEDVESEYRIRTPDGQEKWIRSRTFPIRDQSGRLIKLAGIAEDITERKRHEEELIQAQAEAEAANRQLSAQHAILDNERKMLRTFMDNIPDLMFVKDLEGRFVVSNPALAQQAGVEKPEDMVGKTDFDFFPSEIAGKFHEDDQLVVRSGQPIFDREETIGVNTKDQPRYLLTTKVPIFDSEGRVTGVAGIGRDITMRKMMDDALRESNRELIEATDWANKMALEAEDANRAKSEFLANMSHEIRTPMNGVLGMNGLLLGSNLDQEQRHWAEVVETSAKSLLTVIDDILDFSKVEAGKMEIDTVDFNLHVLMGDFAEIMAERVGEKKLEFICAVAPDVCANLQGDPGRLRQVLLNLVGNAMKFTHQGEVVVRVGLISETDAEVYLRFTVRDTGIGIPEENQQMLFTSFTQVDASTTRKYGGTGLGLAISKKLVELMGGKIGLESKEGVGSEFWFTIRLAKQLASRPMDSPKVPVKGARILVVDDNATNREVITAQLQSWGAVVASVESGATALTCLRFAVEAGSPFQLAVLDMMMPGMDGAALGRAILADDTLKNIPLVMMTSLGQRGDAHRFKEIGFAAYLIKPVRQSDLDDCLVAVLSGETQEETRPLITRHSLLVARRNNARILLVEDNLINQDVVIGMLQRLGWQADVASDGKQAIQALATHPYDLVLMDVQMPEMDGYEATRQIRDPQSTVLNHDIPIIATTAHAMQGDAAKCLGAGMSDYISKPIDPNILAKMVQKWLARKAHTAPGEAPAEAAPDSNTPSPLPMSGSLIFNREVFLQRMMGDEEFAREVAVHFLEDLPELISTMRENVARADIESIWKQAHKIKGSAANVGGELLRDAAMEVEKAGKAGNLDGALHWIHELEMQSSRLIEALQLWGN
jgi:PAS domain S-box-containing protein